MTDDFDHVYEEDQPERRMRPRPDALDRSRRPPIQRDDDAFTIRTYDTAALSGTPDRARDAVDDPLDTDDEDVAFVSDDQDPRPVARQVPPKVRSTRRKAARRARQQAPASAWLSLVRTLLVIGAAAVLVSTIFSLWTRPTFFSDEFRAGLNQVQATQRVVSLQPTPLPTDIHQVRIGIVAGHSGPPEDATFDVDPGAVCPDGLTELSINEAVARRVVEALQRDRYTVDLLEEFDPRLENYHADALVSIHTNDCSDYGEAGTGYNVASASSRQSTRGADERLLSCLIEQYGATTQLPRHFGVTLDMTAYHTFGEVSIDTPTAIIEIGYMRNDRAILTQNPELLAQGIANGIRCFFRPDLYTTANVPTQEVPQ